MARDPVLPVLLCCWPIMENRSLFTANRPFLPPGENSMSPRLAKTIASLSSANSEGVQEAILLIGEVAVFNRKGIKSDVVPEANEEHLGQGDLQILERVLIDFVERNPFGPDAGSAIWCLSKFCNKD